MKKLLAVLLAVMLAVLTAAAAFGEEILVPETEIGFTLKVDYDAEVYQSLLDGSDADRALLCALLTVMGSSKEQMVRPEGMSEELFGYLVEYYVMAASATVNGAEVCRLYLGGSESSFLVVFYVQIEGIVVKREILLDPVTNTGRTTLVAWTAMPADPDADARASAEKYGAAQFGEIPLEDYIEAFSALAGN